MENLPLLFRICILTFCLAVVPTAAGGCFQSLFQRVGAAGKAGAVKGAESAGMSGCRLPFFWVSGQMLLWAGFQLLCVPCVLLELEFHYVVYGFGALAAVLAAAGVLTVVSSKGKRTLKLVPEAGKAAGRGTEGEKTACHRTVQGKTAGGGRIVQVLWVCFFALLLLQLVQAVRLAYGDGDDAYYVAVSAITENADTMYQKLPYTGGTTKVDIRHGLAPFPVWIAFLSRVSGIRAVSVAHIAMPLMLLPMTYTIFYLLGKRLFAGRERQLPLFLIFTELLVLFGDYSFYTVENFMLARSRQGKSALGSIILPMMFLLLFLLLERLGEQTGEQQGVRTGGQPGARAGEPSRDKPKGQKKHGAAYWVLLCGTMTAGCLCSTMGAFLLCLLLAVTGLCAAVSYRQWRVLPPLALCCVPCVCYALLYLIS